MISISHDLLQTWVMGLLLPLIRMLSFMSVAPLFSHNGIPQPIKIATGFILTLAVMPTIGPLPDIDPLSMPGLLIICQQMVIGVAVGMMMRVIFSGIEMAGQVAGMTMGLGFASFFDPQSQGNTVAISQLYGILALLVFLSIDGHLLLISALAESFYSLPIALNSLGVNGMKIAEVGKEVFSIGLQLSLPIIAALLITNMALGILTRSAPQLNIFGIGFPITIGVGFLTLLLILPNMAQPYRHFIEQGIAASRLTQMKMQP
jgi:flagellar biosynthetic protein FliR